MMLIGDEPQSYPSYRDIALPGSCERDVEQALFFSVLETLRLWQDEVKQGIIDNL